MQEFYTLITEVGGAMIANATILGQKVNITNFAVGDGAGDYYMPTAEMTELKREVWRGKPTSVEIDPQNPNMMVVSTVIPADIGGFTIREMGLFTEDGKLIAISNCPELQKVTLSTGVASELALTMQIAVSNAETIEFKVDPTIIIATKSDVEKAKEELETPTFDDSGTVANIQSFTDFMNDIKSKMNIFEFYRNLKAGMQYVLHTGKLINNTNTTEEGFALDARVGKYLQDQIYANKDDAVSKGSVVNNVTTMVDGTVLDGRVGKYLQEQIDEQNNNLNNIVRFIVSDHMTLVDVKEFIINSFDKGIRAINIFQGNKIVLFDETGNFNILVTKYNGNEITAIAVNHWNGNLYSIVFDKLADKFNWQQMITSSHLSLTIKNILNKLDFIEKNYYCLQGGIEIPQYSDLNEYKQTGSYYCPWNAHTMTLKNIPPIGDAFTLIVYYATGSKEYIGQRLYNYWTGKVHYRMFNIFENVWTEWALL